MKSGVNDGLNLHQRNSGHGFMASQLTTNPYPVAADGFLDPYQVKIPAGYGFKIDRDYLNAIPKDQLLLNPSLVQNPGWH